MYASSADVDCFIIPDGDIKISFSTDSECEEVYSAAIWPPSEDPIILVCVIPNDTKNFSKIYSALEMYDVEKLFVEKESLVSRGLTEDDLSVDVKVIDSSEMKKLMSDSEVVFNF